MNPNIALALSVITAYLVGSFPTSYILGRLMKGVDIRKLGSGNVGATNVLRSVGRLPAFVALTIDIVKGILVVTVVADIFYFYGSLPDYAFYRPLLGLSVICGHIWTVFLKFKGGKGIATSLGVLGVLAPLMLGSSLLLWLIIFSFTNYVSLASLVLLISLPLFAALFGYPFYTILLSVAVCAIGTYKHKDNIDRLLRGEESRIFIFKPKAP